VSIDLPVSARVVEASAARPCLMLRVTLDTAAVGEFLANGVTDPPGPGPPARGLAVTPMAPPLVDAVGRLVAPLDTPRDVGPLAPLVLREITYRVLNGPQGARLRQIAAAGVDQAVFERPAPRLGQRGNEAGEVVPGGEAVPDEQDLHRPASATPLSHEPLSVGGNANGGEWYPPRHARTRSVGLGSGSW
jgi:hypothetical protein